MISLSSRVVEELSVHKTLSLLSLLWLPYDFEDFLSVEDNFAY